MGTEADRPRRPTAVLAGVQRALRSTRDRVGALLFGDPVGTTVFIGALLFFVLYWRIGIFINDNYTIANTLVGVTDGHLYIERVPYGPNVPTPGVNVIDGQPYGRNYGHVFLALPVYYLLEAISAIADIRIAIAGAWSFMLWGFLRRVGSLIGSSARYDLLGLGAALLTFAVNAAWAVPLVPWMHQLMALQLVSMIAAALVGVTAYRLLAAIHGRRVGVFVAATIVLASPVAFWASIPKRHALTACFAMIIFYAFYVSRRADTSLPAIWSRSTAYVAVGLWAWVHAPEALVMLLVLVPFDLATARSNSWRGLSVVGGSFLASLLPFFLTNWAIAGNPMKPLRFYGRASAGGGAGGSGGELSLLPPELSPFLAPLEALGGLLTEGALVLLFEPTRVFHTFVRSAPLSTAATATDLTLLETTPIFGVLVALPLLVFGSIKVDRIRARMPASPVRQTDAFGVAFLIAFTLLYMSRLPLHAMWTVRYLLVIVPFGLYFVGRLPPIRRVLAGRARMLTFSYAGFVLIGGQLLVVLLLTIDPTIGEIVQFHGNLGIVAAAVVGAWAVWASFEAGADTRVGAVAIALSLAVGTLFVLLSGLEYFVTGEFALALADRFSDVIPFFGE